MHQLDQWKHNCYAKETKIGTCHLLKLKFSSYDKGNYLILLKRVIISHYYIVL